MGDAMDDPNDNKDHIGYDVAERMGRDYMASVEALRTCLGLPEADDDLVRSLLARLAQKNWLLVDLSRFDIVRKCPTCHGSGEIEIESGKDQCPTCSSVGHVH